MRDRLGRSVVYTLVAALNLYFLPEAIGAAADPNRSIATLAWGLGGAVLAIGAAIGAAMWTVSGD